MTHRAATVAGTNRGSFAPEHRAEATVQLGAPEAPAPPKPTVKKSADFDADSPRYDVEIDGTKIGTVGKGWFRNGGTQWFNSVRGSLYPVGSTRKAAVDHLVRNTSSS